MCMIVFIDVKDYNKYASAIRSGQVCAAHINAIFETDPLFAIWYKFKYGEKK